jgi:predicted kinase
MEAIIFIGIQATGKSTFYLKQFFKTHIRVNMDMLRTRPREDIILAACIKAKQPFVIDNTNPSIVDRAKYIEIVKKAGFKVVGYYFQSNIEDSIRRNSQRIGKEKIPIAGIYRTDTKLELPSYDEGFDRLYYVQITGDGEFKVEEWKEEL